MWWMLAAQLGMSIASNAAQAGANSAQYKADKKWQKYKNTMLSLSAAQSQNAVTTNITQETLASAVQALEIEKATVTQRGDAVVQAAAAGVKGNSVNSAVRAVERSGAEAEYARALDLKNQYLGFDYQRRDIALSAKMGKDTNYIPKPSPVSSILGIAKDATQIGVDNYDYLKAFFH
jgi:hypothetical protein